MVAGNADRPERGRSAVLRMIFPAPVDTNALTTP